MKSKSFASPLLCEEESSIDPRFFEPTAKVYSSVRPVSEGGRNAAWFVEHPLFSGVLKHYRRGGMMRYFSQVSYIWCGQEKTRSWAEYRILQYLYRKGLSVPKALGAIYWRKGYFYQAALLTERIEGAITLVQYLRHEKNEEKRQKVAEKVADIIAKLHELQINHADLNAFNILIDDYCKIYLIDFDKAKKEHQKGSWCEENLQRLHRHLRKVLGEDGETFMSKIRANYQKHS